MRKIPPHVKSAVFAIERAAADEKLYPLDCFDTVTGKPVWVLCIKRPVEGTDQVDMIPVAELFEEPPYERYLSGESAGDGYRGAD